MEFNFRGIHDTRYVFPASSSNYSYFSDIHGRPAIEAVPISVGYPSAMMLGQHPLHGEQYVITVPMPYYGGGGFEAVAFQRPPEIKVVTVYQPQDMEKESIMSGKPTLSGSKRKAQSPPSPTVASSSGLSSKKVIEEWRCAVCDISATSEGGLNAHLTGKKHQSNMESLKGKNNTSTAADTGLAMIKTSMNKQTSQIKCLKGNNNSTGAADIGHGMMIQTSVNKQTSEIKSLKGNNNIGGCGSGDIGLGIIKSSQTCDHEMKNVSKKVKKSGGGKIGKKYKFWCNMCKIGAYDEVVMKDHEKGRKHIKNLSISMKARVQRKSC